MEFDRWKACREYMGQAISYKEYRDMEPVYKTDWAAALRRLSEPPKRRVRKLKKYWQLAKQGGTEHGHEA